MQGLSGLGQLFRYSFLMVAALLAPSTAFADSFLSCAYQIDDVPLRPDGYLSAQFGGARRVFCNLNSTLAIMVPGVQVVNVTPDFCKSLQSTLTTARASGRNVEFVAFTPGATCAAIWTSPWDAIIAPYPWYISLK